jgi:O-antigen/teichoic acid export membrane protein
MVNSLHAASGRIAALVLWLLFTPPILHALGPDGFAVWALFYALTGYLYSMDFGLAQGTLRSAAAARERGDHAEAGAFAQIAVIGYLALGAIWVLATLALRAPILRWLRIPPGLAPDAGFAMVVGAGVFVAGGIANVTMSLLQGYGRFDLANSVLLTMTGAQAVGLAVALRHPTPLRWLVTVVGVASLVGCATGFVIVRAAIPHLGWGDGRETRHRVGEVMRFGGPMQITNLLATIHVHLDKLLISRFVALASVASYELGSRVATMVSTFPQMVLLPVVPESAAMEAAGQSTRLRELYARGSRFYLALAALGTAGAVACAGRVYTVWLGSPQPEATFMLRGLAIAIGVSLLTGMGTTIARGVGRTDLEMWFAVCAVTLHLALSLLWVPRFGLPGALGAILLGNLCGSLLFFVLFSRLMQWPVVGVVVAPVLGPIVAAAAGGLAGWSLDRLLPAAHGAAGWLALTAVGAGSVLGTSLVLWLTGCLRWAEVRVLFRQRA